MMRGGNPLYITIDIRLYALYIITIFILYSILKYFIITSLQLYRKE